MKAEEKPFAFCLLTFTARLRKLQTCATKICRARFYLARPAQVTNLRYIFAFILLTFAFHCLAPHFRLSPRRTCHHGAWWQLSSGATAGAAGQPVLFSIMR